jgi:FtsH-binding integral membrane protein
MTTFGGAVPAVRDTRTLFGQTMGLVAATAGLFALAAYIGRDSSYGFGLVCFIGAFACLIGMRFAVRGAGTLAVLLLAVFGILMGLASAPTVAYYAATDPEAVWQAGGATALFMAGLGSVGYGTRRDLSALARVSFFALIGLVIFGIVLIFVDIPGGSLIYSVLGLVVFAGLTVVDFQRLRLSSDMASAPLIAASIFLDALNVFFFFLRIFGRRD